MQTARFSQIVQLLGRPESHLILTAPARDRALQSAIKQGRVITVIQPTVGSSTDRGVIGFEKGESRQYLIFPKSLRKYEGKKIVGIDYSLLVGGEEVTERKSAKTERNREQVRKATAKEEKPPAKVIKFPKEESPAPEPEEGREEESEARVEENAEVMELKRQVRRAIKALEAGKQVVAFNTLKKIVAE